MLSSTSSWVRVLSLLIHLSNTVQICQDRCTVRLGLYTRVRLTVTGVVALRVPGKGDYI